MVLVVALGCASPNEAELIIDVPPHEVPPHSARVPLDPGLPRCAEARNVYLASVERFYAKQYARAYDGFRRVLEVEPLFYEAWFKMGLCRYYEQKFDLEIECYKKCLAIEPNYLPCLVSLGNAYMAQDETNEAISNYGKILQLDPLHPVALYNLGLIHLDLGNRRVSEKYLERFITACPDDPYRSRAEAILRRPR